MKSTGIVLAEKPSIGDIAPTRLYDRSRFGNHGTFGAGAAAPSLVRLPSGLWTYRFGGDDYIDIDVALNDLASTTKGTWMTWVMLDAAEPVATSYMVAFGDTDAAEYIVFRIRATGQLNAQAYLAVGSAQWNINTDAVALANGQYAHISLIQDGTSPILLVNAVQVAQTIDAAPLDLTAWFATCTGIDNGRIGCFNYYSSGNVSFLTNGNLVLPHLLNYNLSIGQVKRIIKAERHWIGV